MRALRLIGAVAFLLLLPAPLTGQAPSLEGFMAGVARLWAAGDAAALAGLASRDGRMVVDLGTGGGGAAVEVHHAAAALRALFARRDHVSIRLSGAALSGSTPPRGFGELEWISRERGVSDPVRGTVYVGAEVQGGSWRIREIRLMR